MALYALDSIDDAFDATREFLFPFERGRWLRLVLIVLFTGGLGSGFNFQTSGFDVPAPSPSGPTDAPALDPGSLVAILLVVAALIVVLALAFVLVGSVMELVFVESLRSGEVSIRRYFRRYWRSGLRLFAFRLVFGLLTLEIVAIPFVVVFFALSGGDAPGFAAIFSAILLLIALLFIVIAIAGLINGFTTVFVVPIMLVEGRGVLSAWRRFWPTLRGQWKQYAGYVFIELGLSIVAGITVLFVSLLALLFVGIPFALLAGLTLFVLGRFANLSTAGIVVLGLLGVVFGLLMLVALLAIQVPIQTYFRFYALFVLGDTNDAFDLILDRRAAIRSDVESSASGERGGESEDICGDENPSRAADDRGDPIEYVDERPEQGDRTRERDHSGDVRCIETRDLAG